jgi:alpha-tubulin suppressor-like RCC1 family protein
MMIQGCLGVGPDYDVLVEPKLVQFDSEVHVISVKSSSAVLIVIFTLHEKASCGYHHSICATSDGILYGWGCNEQGQIAISQMSSWIPCKITTALFKAKIVACGAFHTAVVCDLSQLYTFGSAVLFSINRI